MSHIRSHCTQAKTLLHSTEIEKEPNKYSMPSLEPHERVCGAEMHHFVMWLMQIGRFCQRVVFKWKEIDRFFCCRK